MRVRYISTVSQTCNFWSTAPSVLLYYNELDLCKALYQDPQLWSNLQKKNIIYLWSCTFFRFLHHTKCVKYLIFQQNIGCSI